MAGGDARDDGAAGPGDRPGAVPPGVPQQMSAPSAQPTRNAVSQGELLALVPVLRRFVASRVERSEDIDDVVQETIARVLATGGSFEESTLTSYAVTVARNVITSHHRHTEVERRHAPKLVDLREPDQPEALALAGEERAALAAALSELPRHQRDLLVGHVVHDEQLAAGTGGPGGSGAVAAQLARTRARLRLDYVIALRRTTLSTPRCRPVLLALAAGDRRRQTALRAGEHLLTCASCASLSEPLLTRRRALAGVVPVLTLGSAHGAVVRALRQNPVRWTAGAAGATAAVVAAVALLPQDQPAPQPPVLATPTSPPATGPAPLTTVSGTALSAADLTPLVGVEVRATGVRVLAVPADEGFWIGDGGSGRVWVQLRGRGESPTQVEPAQRLDFRARVVATTPAFLAETGLGGDQAALLERQGVHLELPARGLITTPGGVRPTPR